MSEVSPIEIQSVPRKSFFSRFFGIFYEPGEVFRYLDQKPDIYTALIIPIIVTFIASVAAIILNYRNPEYIQAMSKLPAKTLNMVKYGTPIIGGIFGILIAVGLLLMKAGIIHVVAPFLDGKSTFKKLVTVLGFSYAPFLIFCVIMLASALINSESYIPFTASLALIFPKEKVGLSLYTLYSQFDIFAFWSLFLSIIGVSIIYKFGWKKAALILVTLWVLGTGIQYGFTKAIETLIPQSKQTSSQTD